MPDAIETLVGGRIVQSTKSRIIRAELQIIQQRKQVGERFKLVTAAVETGFQSMLPDDAKGDFQFGWIPPFTHEADTGDEGFVARDQRIQIALQRLTDILLKISGMAAATMVEAVGDRERQADLLRHLCQRHGAFHILQRRLSPRR